MDSMLEAHLKTVANLAQKVSCEELLSQDKSDWCKQKRKYALCRAKQIDPNDMSSSMKKAWGELKEMCSGAAPSPASSGQSRASQSSPLAGPRIVELGNMTYEVVLDAVIANCEAQGGEPYVDVDDDTGKIIVGCEK